MGHFGLNSYRPFERITWPSALLFGPPGCSCPAGTSGAGNGRSGYGGCMCSTCVVGEGYLVRSLLKAPNLWPGFLLACSAVASCPVAFLLQPFSLLALAG